MAKKLTQGEINRRANIKALKAVGRANAKARKAQAKVNKAAHLAAMAQRSADAATARAERRVAGIARRDAHNAALKAAAATKADAYEIAAARPVAMGDGYGVPTADVAAALKAA